MKLRTIFLLLILGAIGAFSLLNWNAFITPTTVSLGLAEVQAPLGAIMLGMVVFLTAFFLVFVVYMQASAIFDSRRHAQELQHGIMGYLPGFATPRIVCDVPFVGKRWVHQAHSHDPVRGISQWTKNYRTSLETDDPEALARTYPYYDPVDTLPAEGQRWWRARVRSGIDGA